MDGLIKRGFDVALSALALILLLPLTAAVSVAIWLTMGRPVLFRQVRPGLHGKPFTLLKFRTMLDARDTDGRPLPDRLRVTWLGRFLRGTSMDEIPQLLNVLRGEMSIVGPRPLLPEYLPCYTPREALRHRMLPGLTGLAQVSGRSRLGWDRRLELDVQYVEKWSLGLDLRILLLTVRKVITRADVLGCPQGSLLQCRNPKAGVQG